MTNQYGDLICIRREEQRGHNNTFDERRLRARAGGHLGDSSGGSKFSNGAGQVDEEH